jgi:hypothetical protein
LVNKTGFFVHRLLSFETQADVDGRTTLRI